MKMIPIPQEILDLEKEGRKRQVSFMFWTWNYPNMLLVDWENKTYLTCHSPSYYAKARKIKISGELHIYINKHSNRYSMD